MLCEMCGSDAKHLRDVKIAGSVLKVCAGCAPLGTTPTLQEKLGQRQYVAQALERRAQRRRVRDPTTPEKMLITHYGACVRQARERQGWDHEQLAHRAAEKKSIITSVESGRHRPNEKLRHKLESLLGIKLTEKVVGDDDDDDNDQPAPPHQQRSGAPLTMGDLLRDAMNK